MINSKISKQPNGFPCLMANEHVIALFHDEKIGIIAHGLHGSSVDAGGLLRDNFDYDQFTPYNGVVELSNS